MQSGHGNALKMNDTPCSTPGMQFLSGTLSGISYPSRDYSVTNIQAGCAQDGVVVACPSPTRKVIFQLSQTIRQILILEKGDIACRT